MWTLISSLQLRDGQWHQGRGNWHREEGHQSRLHGRDHRQGFRLVHLAWRRIDHPELCGRWWERFPAAGRPSAHTTTNPTSDPEGARLSAQPAAISASPLRRAGHSWMRMEVVDQVVTRLTNDTLILSLHKLYSNSMKQLCCLIPDRSSKANTNNKNNNKQEQLTEEHTTCTQRQPHTHAHSHIYMHIHSTS